jgi:hypothetical protein
LTSLPPLRFAPWFFACPPTQGSGKAEGSYFMDLAEGFALFKEPQIYKGSLFCGVLCTGRADGFSHPPSGCKELRDDVWRLTVID